MQHHTKSIRPFIGARDFEVSRSFYRHLGFTETVLDTRLSVFHADTVSFYLQDAYVPGWIDNTMIFIEVDDADRYWKELSALELARHFPGSRLSPVRTESWGRECFVHDPSGILWHFGSFA